MNTLRMNAATTPALVVVSALLIAFYGSVWRIVYAAGIPTGLASSITQALPLLALILFSVLTRHILRRRDVAFFAALSLGSGFGAVVGSMLGNPAGATGLVAGALAGGIVASFAIVRVSARLAWIPRAAVVRTSWAAAAGFLIASVIAVNTLSSPVGPVASTMVVGAAGLWALWYHREPRAT